MQVDIKHLEQAARAAGVFMKASNDTDHTDKSNRKDFVTVADIKSQDILRKELTTYYPDVVILSEEDSEEDRKQLFDTDFTGFVLDPIDGTYNFKRGMKESAISIGFAMASRFMLVRRLLLKVHQLRQAIAMMMLA